MTKNKKEINLTDLFQILRKNLNIFYLFIILGIIVGLSGIAINTNLISKKNSIEAKIFIKNPLNNFDVLEIFSLQKTLIKNDKINFLLQDEKIRNYYFICKEYLKLISNEINLEQFLSYETELIINEVDFIIKLKNLKYSENEKIESTLIEFVNDINKSLKPIILKNAFIQNSMLNDHLNTNSNFKNNESTQKFINSINKNLEHYENVKLDIFEISMNKKSQEINNGRIFMVSILLSFTLFLMLVILKK